MAALNGAYLVNMAHYLFGQLRLDQRVLHHTAKLITAALKATITRSQSQITATQSRTEKTAPKMAASAGMMEHHYGPVNTGYLLLCHEVMKVFLQN